MKRTLVLDFDGVIHSYTSKWTGWVPQDPPVDGALEFVEWALGEGGFDRILVASARVKDGGGDDTQQAICPYRVEAVEQWLEYHGFPVGKGLEVHTGVGKPHADLYVDDRGYRFEGSFNHLKMFVDNGGIDPWNRAPGEDDGYSEEKPAGPGLSFNVKF